MTRRPHIEADPIAAIMQQSERPTLLIGNGINRFSNSTASSWEDLLATISKSQNLVLSNEELREMSNTELFDVLDLARPVDDRSNLQRSFCDLMKTWTYGPHHSRIVNWAQRHASPIITVNFDENLAQSADTSFFRQCGLPDAPRFTDFYPWRSYFGVEQLSDPTEGFGIWHAHGTTRYARSIRLGLTHYMGSVHRARSWIYRTDGSLIRYLQGKSRSWNGVHTWLQPFFCSDVAILGFGFGKDETFLRWLFLERARLHKRFPSKARKGWYVVENNEASHSRKVFFEQLGIELVIANSHAHIYESTAWDT